MPGSDDEGGGGSSTGGKSAGSLVSTGGKRGHGGKETGGKRAAKRQRVGGDGAPAAQGNGDLWMYAINEYVVSNTAHCPQERKSQRAVAKGWMTRRDKRRRK